MNIFLVDSSIIFCINQLMVWFIKNLKIEISSQKSWVTSSWCLILTIGSKNLNIIKRESNIKIIQKKNSESGTIKCSNHQFLINFTRKITKAGHLKKGSEKQKQVLKEKSLVKYKYRRFEPKYRTWVKAHSWIRFKIFSRQNEHVGRRLWAFPQVCTHEHMFWAQGGGGVEQQTGHYHSSLSITRRVHNCTAHSQKHKHTHICRDSTADKLKCRPIYHP